MQVVGYIRVSTEEQDQSGLGLADQTARIKQYCDLYALELVHVHKDAASGKNMNRPGLQSALAMLKNGEASGLVILKLDRLSRSVKDIGQLLEEYQAYSIRSVNEQLDTSSASGKFVVNLLASFGQYERELIGERTRAAMAQLKSQGRFCGGFVPWGYTLSGGGRLVEDQHEQEWLSEMVELRAQGYSYNRISDWLNANQVKSKSGGEWYPPAVRRVILSNQPENIRV